MFIKVVYRYIVFYNFLSMRIGEKMTTNQTPIVLLIINLYKSMLVYFAYFKHSYVNLVKFGRKIE